jgi:hypothetical protein
MIAVSFFIVQALRQPHLFDKPTADCGSARSPGPANTVEDFVLEQTGVAVTGNETRLHHAPLPHRPTAGALLVRAVGDGREA